MDAHTLRRLKNMRAPLPLWLEKDDSLRLAQGVISAQAGEGALSLYIFWKSFEFTIHLLSEYDLGTFMFNKITFPCAPPAMKSIADSLQ